MLKTFLNSVAILAAVTACNKKQDSCTQSSPSSELALAEETAPNCSAENNSTASTENASGGSTSVESVSTVDPANNPTTATSAGKDCIGCVKDGATARRIRYQSAQASLGNGGCHQETQEATCVDGTLAFSGTFTEESCLVTAVTASAGDIAILAEDGGIHLVSPTGQYKGLGFDPAGKVPWYSYNLRLSKDYYGDYFAEIGSVDSNLGSTVMRFPAIASYPYAFQSPTLLANSGSHYNKFFEWGFSADRRGARYIGDRDGTDYVLRRYPSGGPETLECQITFGANRRIANIYTHPFRFFSTRWIAFEDLNGSGFVTGYGVSKINDTCAPNGSVETPSQLFTRVAPDAKVVDLVTVYNNTSAGPTNWRDNIFLHQGGFLYEKSVERWYQLNGQWTRDAHPFMGVALAMTQDGIDAVYTLERNDSGDTTTVYLRKYNAVADGNGSHYVATLLTDPTGNLFGGNFDLGVWMMVFPQTLGSY